MLNSIFSFHTNGMWHLNWAPAANKYKSAVADFCLFCRDSNISHHLLALKLCNMCCYTRNVSHRRPLPSLRVEKNVIYIWKSNQFTETVASVVKVIVWETGVIMGSNSKVLFSFLLLLLLLFTTGKFSIIIYSQPLEIRDHLVYLW